MSAGDDAPLLALDLGGTRVSALAVAVDCSVIARASRPLAVHFPQPGRVEHDPEDMWQQSLAVLREAISDSGRGADEFAGLGIVTQRATALAWESETLRPLAPAISWQDSRTASRCAALAAQGLPVNSMSSATKFEWLVAEVPDVARAAANGRLRLGTPDVWLAAKLSDGACFATDPTQAAPTLLYSPPERVWAPGLLDLFGIDAAWLPEIVPTTALSGSVARQWLGAEIPLAARAGDQQASAFAQGAHRKGEAKLTLGTAGMLNVSTGEEIAAPPPGTYPLPLWWLADGTSAFCLEGTVVTAGAAVDWLVTAGLLGSPQELDALASTEPHSDGVLFVPAFEGLGTPFLDPEARGFVGGLTRGSTRGHLARALIDGLAQRCADIALAMPDLEGPLRVDGGVGQSDLLLQRLADLLGREIHRAEEREATALGAAFLAGLGVGSYASPDELRGRAAVGRSFEAGIDAAAREADRASWRRALDRTRTLSSSSG